MKKNAAEPKAPAEKSPQAELYRWGFLGLFLAAALAAVVVWWLAWPGETPHLSKPASQATDSKAVNPSGTPAPGAVHPASTRESTGKAEAPGPSSTPLVWRARPEGKAVGSNETEAPTPPAPPTAPSAKAVTASQVELSGTTSPSPETEVLTPPQTPIGLQTGTLSSDRVQLFWTDPNTPPAEIRIERQRGPGGPLTALRAEAGEDGFQDRDLTPNTLYVYRVWALNSAGQSDYSDAVQALTLPERPTGIRIENATQQALTLSWSTPNSPPARVIVERATPGSNFETVGEAPPGIFRFADRGLLPNTPYVYRLRTFNDEGDSEFSSEAEGLTLPTAPDSVTADLLRRDAVSIRWSLAGPPPDAIRIQREDEDGGLREFTEIGRTDFVDTNLWTNTLYRYRVQTLNRAGASPYSNWAETLTPPAAPSSLTAVVRAPDHVDLAWRDNSARPSAFRLERSDSRGGFTELAWIDPGARQFSDLAALPGRIHLYRVAAANEAGFSEYSNTIQIVTPEWVFPADLRLETSGATAGATVAAALILSGPAPATGLSARLVSSHPAFVEVPERLSFLPGEQRVEFLIATAPDLETPLRARVTAECLGRTASADLTVQPPAPPDLAAERIDFIFLDKDGSGGRVRIAGVVNNAGSGDYVSRPGQQRVLLLEISGAGRKLLAERRFESLEAGREIVVEAEFDWRIVGDATPSRPATGGYTRRGSAAGSAPGASQPTNPSAAQEGEAPEYQLVIEYAGGIRGDGNPRNDDADPNNNRLTRRGSDILRMWRRSPPNEPF